jgi:hypothetical protein
MNQGKRLFSAGSPRVSGPRERQGGPSSGDLLAGLGLRALLLIAGSMAPGASEALAQQTEPSSSRVLQMLGINGGSSASEPADNNPAQGSRVLQMLGLTRGSPNAPAGKPTLSECPEIVVDGGGAELRAPPGADASSVRYQIAISRTARECAMAGNDIAVKVGIMGSAVLGPVGQPGAYFGNLRVALRRKSDEQLFGAKNYRVGANIPAGAARADFNLLVEGLEAPYISQKAAEDYEVVMGFTQSGAESAAPKSEKKRRSRAE